MKRIIHISDLHFGTERPGILSILTQDIKAQHPELIIVSGDLTQRARKQQYINARQFLCDLSHCKILCVPGNHDISLYNWAERFLYPYRKYNHYIKNEFLSIYEDDDMAVVGINSVTPFKAMSGYVTDKQLSAVSDFFNKRASAKYKLVVMHHNLIRSERHKVINESEKIIKHFAACHVNLILAGHIHAAHLEHLERSHFSHPMYIVTAGTAISTRTIEPNSYNIITLDNQKLTVIVREFNGDEFIVRSEVILPI